MFGATVAIQMVFVSGSCRASRYPAGKSRKKAMLQSGAWRARSFRNWSRKSFLFRLVRMPAYGPAAAVVMFENGPSR